MTAMPLHEEDGAPRARRNKILKKGIVSFFHQHSTRACTVHELSETGALLRFVDDTVVPAEFELTIELDGFKVPCKFVRRVGNKVAVTFTGERETVKVARKQVVQPSFDPAQILKDRQDEINQIAENMRMSSTFADPKVEAAKQARRAIKSFGRKRDSQ